MQILVFKAMAEGAIGFSTGLQYVPGVYAKPNEIIELARVAGNEGGIYATHMRNEGTAVEESIAESIRAIRRLDMPLEISHLKIDSPSRWGSSPSVLKMIDDARALGMRIQADAYAYTSGASSLVDPVSGVGVRWRGRGDARAAARSGRVAEDQSRDGGDAGRAWLHGFVVGDGRQLPRRSRP